MANEGGDNGWNFGPDDGPSPDEIEEALKNVTQKGRRRRNVRRTASTMGAVSAVTLVIAGLTFGVGSVDSPLTDVAGWNKETTTTSTTSTSTTLPPKPSDGRPETLVAYAATGGSGESGPYMGLASFDPRTGQLLKVLDANATGGSVQLSPDARRVYYDSYLPSKGGVGCAGIYEVSIDGSERNLLIRGARQAALSIDGKQIAFISYNCDIGHDSTDGPVNQQLRVYDIGSKTTRTIAEVRYAYGTHFDSPMWTTDGKYVVAAVVTTSGGSLSRSTLQYDVSVKNPVNMYGDPTTRDFDPPDHATSPGEKQPAWRTEQMLPDGSVLATLYCCNFSSPAQYVRLVVVKDGRITRTIATSDNQQASVYDFADAASDPKGNHILFIARGEEGSSNDLWVLDNGVSKPVSLVKNVIAADWK